MLVLKLILLSVVLLGIALTGMGISILVRKNGKFPEHRVGHNREMRKRKIYCVKTQDKIDQNAALKLRRLKRQKLENFDEDLIAVNPDEKADLNNITLA